MTDGTRTWDDEILVNEDGTMAFDEECCCGCDRPQCCQTLNDWYSATLLMDISSECGALTAQTMSQMAEIDGMEVGDWGGSGPAGDTVIVTCIDVGEIGAAQLKIRYNLVLSDSCQYIAEQTVDVDCFPLDVTVQFDTTSGEIPPGNSCCGLVTIRLYIPDCPPTGCGCMFNNYCLPSTLVATLTALTGECAELDGQTVTLTCTNDCPVEGGVCCWASGLTQVGADADCVYNFILIGVSENNRWCDFYLTIKNSAGDVIYESRTVSATEEGFDLIFGPVTIAEPCCDGAVQIDITE